MGRMTVEMAQMNPRKSVMSALVNRTSFAARTTVACQVDGSATTTMTVETTLMKRPARLDPALKVSSPVPMAVALLGDGSVMVTMTASTALMRKTVTCAVMQTSSSAKMGTASHTAGAVMLMQTAWMAVMRKIVALEYEHVPWMSSSVTTLYASLWPGNAMVRMTVETILTRTQRNA